MGLGRICVVVLAVSFVAMVASGLLAVALGVIAVVAGVLRLASRGWALIGHRRARRRLVLVVAAATLFAAGIARTLTPDPFRKVDAPLLGEGSEETDPAAHGRALDGARPRALDTRQGLGY